MERTPVLRTLVPGLLALCALLFWGAVSPALSAESGDALLKKARELAAEGRTAEAIAAARQAVKAEPGNAAAQEQLGFLLLGAGQADEAIAAFDAALKENPTQRTAKTGKGLALFKKGDAAAAEGLLKEALTMNPNPSPAHYALGLLYESRGDYEKAIEQFKEGLKKLKSVKK